ncbi:Hok/Gef family protein [Escherichia coli]|uniref:Hok/Gef family protein n=1 Tax=Escherichia coli TaxID=562 RepID=UPI0020235332|nr:Hok/Gef family protein [Escherichia coli]
MKQQKAMLIALIVICLTVIVTALVTRKDLCEVRIRTPHLTRFGGFLFLFSTHLKFWTVPE